MNDGLDVLPQAHRLRTLCLSGAIGFTVVRSALFCVLFLGHVVPAHLSVFRMNRLVRRRWRGGTLVRTGARRHGTATTRGSTRGRSLVVPGISVFCWVVDGVCDYHINERCSSQSATPSLPPLTVVVRINTVHFTTVL